MNSVLEVQEAWRKATSELGIQFVCPFSLRNGCDTVQFHGMVPGFGSPKGTVFIASVTLEEDVSAASRLAGECGYFFSIISAASYANFDRSSFLETLKDWGWQNMEIVPPQGFARPIKTKKKAPNQSLETTTLAVTPSASHPSRQPRSRLT